jgi:hypothetical protein
MPQQGQQLGQATRQLLRPTAAGNTPQLQMKRQEQGQNEDAGLLLLWVGMSSCC